MKTSHPNANIIFKITFFFTLIITFSSCVNQKATEVSTSTKPDTVLTYATGFTIRSMGKFKVIEVRQPYQGASSGYKYLLVPRGETPPSETNGARVIYTPLKSVVCTSTTHIPLIEYLNETRTLTGFPTTDYISSVKVRQRIDSGYVEELGVDQGLNIEKLVLLKPDMVMGYTMSSDYGQFKKIEELGIPVVINAEYLEKHPLGRAEWIKFMGLFYNKEREADSIFKTIEHDYLATKAMVDSAKVKPTILSGIVYGDGWFLPGGQNYASKVLKDAGCQYIWAADSSNGFLELSFEVVYDKAHDADLWVGVGSFKSLKEIEVADHRYTKFKPFKQKQIYSYDARKGAKGGSEFLELGYLRPDIILKDLVKIAHPELLPGHALYFHIKLE
ncbi:MAG: ABC transporter substrate-binding protein [Chryseolinea sp.]